MDKFEMYDNIEDIPDVEVTLEKVFDGYPFMYSLATRELQEAKARLNDKVMFQHYGMLLQNVQIVNRNLVG